MSLTALQIRAFSPGATAYKRADERGLYLEIFPNGSKLWRLKYYVGGKEKRIALGAWPEVSLQAARLERDELRLRIAKGEDPALTRKKNKATAKISAANTFESVAREYIENKMVGEGRAEATLLKARWFLDLLKPAIGHMPISDVDPQMMLAPLKKLEARGNRETAKKCRSFASRVFRYGAATGRCTTDPTAILKGALLTPLSFETVGPDATGTVVCIDRGKNNRLGEVTVGEEEAIFLDGTPPTHKAPIRYCATADGFKPGAIKVISLASWHAGIYVTCRLAKKLTPPKKPTGRARGGPDLVTTLNVPGSGRYELLIFTSPGVELDETATGTLEDGQGHLPVAP